MNLYFTFCRRVLLFPLPGGSCAVDVVRVAVQPLPGVLPPLWPHLLVPAGPDQQGDSWRGCEAPTGHLYQLLPYPQISKDQGE